MSNTPDMNKEREAFEAWYCDQMRAAGYNADEGIAQLREGNHYGKERVMLNGKWEGWQARASLAASAGSEPVAWGIFDSEGFYEVALDEGSGQRFVDHYNKRRDGPLKPFSLRALYTHPSPPEGAGWRPIETAPKDGTEILLHAPACEYEGTHVKARTTHGHWRAPSDTPRIKYQDGFAPEPEWEDFEPFWASWDGGFTEEHPPTHWMPLPAPPASEAKGA
jgi:hypothetical protein